MNILKKFLIIILSLLMVFCVAVACDTADKEPGGDDTDIVQPGGDDDDNPGGNPSDDYEVLEFTDGQSITLAPGAMYTLKLQDNTASLTFESSDSEVVEIDGALIIVRKVGTVTITAKEGTETVATLTIESKQSVTGVALDRTEVQLMKDSTLQLTATVAPETANNKNISWKTSDETIASVDSNGLITALKAGNATITVTTEDGNFTAECQVTVLELFRNMNGWNAEAIGGGVPSVGFLEGEDGMVQLVHSAAPYANNGLTYREKAFDANQNVKVTLDYTQPCCDGSQWIMLVFGTRAPSMPDNPGSAYGFSLIIRNINDLAIQVQGDWFGGDKIFAEGGTAPVYSEKQEQHQTLLTNGQPNSKGIVAELVKTDTGFNIVVTNLYDSECTMTYTVSDTVAAQLATLSDIYVTVYFNIQSASLASTGIVEVKAEGVDAKAITDVSFAEEEVEKYVNDGDFTLLPTAEPADIAPIWVFSSSDTSVATVDNTGKVTLTGKLSADGVVITAKAMNGAVSDSYKLYVLPNRVDITPKHAFGENLMYILSSQPLSSFSVETGTACVSETPLQLEIGFKGTAYLYFFDKTTLELIASFDIGAEDYAAAVDGVVSLGEQIIEVPADQKVNEIRLSASNIEASISEATPPVLTAEVFPINATNKVLTWESSNTGVLTVDAETGAITLVGIGTSVVTVSATDGSGVTASCTVKVVEDVFTVGSWTGRNGIAFDKDSTEDELIIHYTTQNSTAINGIARNSAPYSLEQTLTFRLNWLDNYLCNDRLQWMGFCLTNAEGNGVAIKYIKTQGANAGINMTAWDTTGFTEIGDVSTAFTPGNEGVTDFFYAGVETAYFDMKIEKTDSGMRITNSMHDNPWYTAYYDLTAAQAALFEDEVYISILIQSEGTNSTLEYGSFSITKQ